jgi:protein-L-isoaspartate O-methyltransferase
MVIPVKEGFAQSIKLIIKNNEKDLEEQTYPGFIFVPLV